MTKEQVLRVLGPPDYSRTAYFKARDELVWDWRACTYNVNIQRLYVLFDATAGAVRGTMTQDELFGPRESRYRALVDVPVRMRRGR